MTAKSAWRNFEKSGLISDYLIYKNITVEEGKGSENQHTGSDNKGHGGAD